MTEPLKSPPQVALLLEEVLSEIPTNTVRGEDLDRRISRILGDSITVESSATGELTTIVDGHEVLTDAGLRLLTPIYAREQHDAAVVYYNLLEGAHT